MTGQNVLFRLNPLKPFIFFGQWIWASAPEAGPDGEHVTVLVLTLGRARVVRHHGYRVSDWQPLEGW